MKRDRRTRQETEAGAPATATAMFRRHRVALAGSLLPALAAGVALASPGAAKQPAPAQPPAPTITSHPAALTNQTSAQFQYSAPGSGTSFECQLDSGSFASCPAAGKSYAGPLAPGADASNARVRAARKSGAGTAGCPAGGG